MKKKESVTNFPIKKWIRKHVHRCYNHANESYSISMKSRIIIKSYIFLLEKTKLQTHALFTITKK